jgi:hypothetical protein
MKVLVLYAGRSEQGVGLSRHLKPGGRKHAVIELTICGSKAVIAEPEPSGNPLWGACGDPVSSNILWTACLHPQWFLQKECPTYRFYLTWEMLIAYKVVDKSGKK